MEHIPETDEVQGLILKKKKKSLATVCKMQRGAKRTLDGAEAATTAAGPPPNWRSGERL